MSLRYVHIVFITLSVILVAGFAMWGLRDYRLTGNLNSLILALGSAVLILPILIYGRWFWRKSRAYTRQIVTVSLLPAATVLHPGVSHACSVCAVDPNSLMAQGAFWGILVLGLVIASLLAAIAGIGFYWLHRARQLNSHV